MALAGRSRSDHGSRAEPARVVAAAIAGRKNRDSPVEYSAIVKEGVDDANTRPRRGPHSGHRAAGPTGNVGVAAHRDTLFRNLKDVRRDDRITLTTLDGEYVYRVVSFQIVKPTDVSVLDPSPDENTLTLVTCYPFYFVGHAPKRFIVRALQEGFRESR